jgi:homocysteine S-methyltransferase
MNTSKNFLELLKGNRPILSDGAMGTLLHQRGAKIDECWDFLNISQPAIVAEIHREYIEAGAQIIQTNTFGANRYKLARHGLENRIAEINTAGVELVRRVAMASFKNILIAGDVGPLGVRLAPFGRVQHTEAQLAFHEQILALSEAGVDLIIIETITDLFEIREAVKAGKSISSTLPIIASMTFTRDDRTLLGDSPQKAAKKLNEYGADVIGVNCSGGPNQILRILKQMRQAVPNGHFSVMPNAGFPEQSGGRVMYSAGPDYFGQYALAFWQAGADVIGGCCGTTSEHMKAMHTALERTPIEKVEITQPASREVKIPSPKEEPTQLAQKLKRGEFVVAVEMDPPRGLSTHKLIAGASTLSEAQADVINVADSPMARMRMSPWAVCSLLQRKTGTETVLHFPTRGRNMLRVQGDLLAAHALNVRNVFVVMGDPTAIGDYPEAMDNYDLVPSGLIKLIEDGFNTGVDHAGADIGQPTSFFVGCALNLNPKNIEREIKILHRKVKAGADFILTQPVYSPEVVKNFLQRYENEFGVLGVPVLVGILPLASSRHATFLQNEVPGITIPEDIHARMRAAGSEGAAEGVKTSIEIANGIRSIAGGIYIMPAFNRFDYAAEIIEAVKSENK